MQLPKQFAWLSLLPPPERDEFVSELLAALAHNGSHVKLSGLIADWRATAEALASPAVMRALGKAGKTTYTDWRVSFGKLSSRAVR